jgi:ketol-acid reductoisomerase
MTTIYYEKDAEEGAIAGLSLAVVGYGNQGRSWALNLRDSGLDPRVHARADASREQASADGFEVGAIADASSADVVCLIVPDDVIPELPIERPEDGLTLVASGYTLAFGRLRVPGDLGMVAPRMLGPEVRRCYQEGAGFITAVGVQHDATGRALARTLAIAKAIGGLREGAIALTPHQEAVLDLGVEQVLSPALTHVNGAFVRVMLEQGIPLEAILTELYLSGEVERTYALLRKEGFAAQMEHHSPVSQFGQLWRRGSYDALDFVPIMRKITEEISSGRFADVWDAEARSGYARMAKLKEQHAGPAVRAMEEQLRSRLGPGAGR